MNGWWRTRPRWGTNSEFQRGGDSFKSRHYVSLHTFYVGTFFAPFEIRNQCLTEARRLSPPWNVGYLASAFKIFGSNWMDFTQTLKMHPGFRGSNLDNKIIWIYPEICIISVLLRKFIDLNAYESVNLYSVLTMFALNLICYIKS